MNERVTQESADQELAVGTGGGGEGPERER